MSRLLDTNFLIEAVRTGTNFIDAPYLSIVSVAEIYSLAQRNGWGQNKLQQLEKNLSQVLIIEVDRNLVDAYVEIDVYSQGKHPTLPSAFTARNMGKNDLWIAATAFVLEIPLYTKDNDFDHLNGVFIQIVK